MSAGILCVATLFLWLKAFINRYGSFHLTPCPERFLTSVECDIAIDIALASDVEDFHPSCSSGDIQTRGWCTLKRV